MDTQSFIASASSQNIKAALLDLKANFFNQGELTDSFNPLLLNSIEALEYYDKGPNHHATNNSYLINYSDASTYLASSTLLHNFDGWSYLSNALDSLVKGDIGVCVHLAYYAELRATMAFLASQGIGVFNDRHLILKANNSFLVQGGLSGTHIFVWNAIKEWSISPSIDGLNLLKIFSAQGISFDKWILNFHPRVTLGMSGNIVHEWLRDWNFDVQAFRNDKGLRGEVSYRPQRLSGFSNLGLNEIVDRIEDFWRIVEPSGNYQFEILDKYLLASLLKRLYDSLVKDYNIIDSFESLVEKNIENLGLSLNQSLINILTGTVENRILLESKKPSFDSNGDINPFSILARATLMLRLSTGVNSELFREANVKQTDLNFWFDRFGISNGFWKPANCPDNFSKLWLSVEENIVELKDTIAEITGPIDLETLNERISYPLTILKQYHRAGLWGLNLN